MTSTPPIDAVMPAVHVTRQALLKIRCDERVGRLSFAQSSLSEKHCREVVSFLRR